MYYLYCVQENCTKCFCMTEWHKYTIMQFGMYYLYSVWQNCTKFTVFACLNGTSTPSCTVWHVLLIQCLTKLHKVKCFCMPDWHKYIIMHSLICTTYTVSEKIVQLSVLACLNGLSIPSCTVWHVLLIQCLTKLDKVKCFCMSEWHKYIIMHSLICTTFTVSDKIVQS